MLYTEKEKMRLSASAKVRRNNTSKQMTAYDLGLVGQGRLCVAGTSIDPAYIDTGN